MRVRYFNGFILVALASSFLCGFASAEYASKVKRVLLYNKVGGWMNYEGIQEVKDVFAQLAKSKGFKLDSLTDDTQLTPEYLKQFQVIIWNNNSEGARSVPTASAREAVINYVNQGGGWLLIHRSGDHANSWPALREALGTKFVSYYPSGNADLVPDSGAKAHSELKYVVTAIPEKIRLFEAWFHFENTVRPLPGVTVLYTASNGEPTVLSPPQDSSGDHPMIWARTIGKGKLFYSGLGQGSTKTMEQADSALPKLYWQSLRWLAGDFQNGCTDKQSPRYDSTARIDDGSCAQLSTRKSLKLISRSPQIVTRSGQRVQLDLPNAGAMQVAIRDLKGTVIFKQNVTDGKSEFRLDGNLKAGMYSLEAISGRKSVRHSLIVQ